MSLDNVKDTYDLYNDLCSDLDVEIDFKKSQLAELDEEIKERLELINQFF